MTDTGIKPFLCDDINKALIRDEWVKWLRSVELYLASEDIKNYVKKRNKLLHLGGTQLQEVAYSLPGALATYDTEQNNDVYKVLVEKLSEHFSPAQNTTFERHVFRHLKKGEGENFNKFLLKVRQQAKRCSFGKTETEAIEINVKDKIIDEWAPLELKRKLLEKERSMNEIIEMCQVHEHTDDQSATMDVDKAGPSTAPIHKIGIQQKDSNQCLRCGRLGHARDFLKCPAREAKCRKCGFQGHFALCCRTRQSKRKPNSRETSDLTRKRYKPNINFLAAEDTEEETQDNRIKGFDCFKINKMNGKMTSDDLIVCVIGRVPVMVLIDSGSKVNVINDNYWETLLKEKAVVWDVSSKTEDVLRPYASGSSLQIKHKLRTTISVPGRSEIIAIFYVVLGGDISLIGKDTAKQLGVLKLGLECNKILSITPFPKAKDVIVKLSIDPYVKPIQQPLRRIPVAVEAQVEEKLNEALRSDVIEKVNAPSAWISPIVVVFKPTGDIRICVDMRRANLAIRRENYPLPTVESFMTKMNTAKYFSRLDLTNAYHQLELDEDSREITTFITHKGVFRYKRLMFGVNSAPEIFQRTFEAMLSSCQNCLNYIDDIIVYGPTESEHDRCLKKVLEVLNERNVLLNKPKCAIKVRELDFLGHKLSDRGIEADEKKIRTVQDFRPPETKEEVRSFLGLVTYLGKFIPDLGTLTEPLRQLTKSDVKFVWTEDHRAHFNKLKESLARLPTLAYFDAQRRTRLVADASPVALGAVLLQFHDNNDPRVISFASKSLSEVERRYSQTEKESLAPVWGVERFYFYLAGLEFELMTDHKPLEAIFKPTAKPPARIERWLLRLQTFKFRVVFQPGKLNIADSLSRLCKLGDAKSFDTEGEHHVFTMMEVNTPKAMDISQIVSESKMDQDIVEAVDKINNESWKSSDKNKYGPFKSQLATMGPVLLRGSRIIIPKSLTQRVLELAHEGHPGETVMKRRLRAKVWWPTIDRQVEQFVKGCRECLMVSQPNKPPPMFRHTFPERPWQCVAIDLMGPLPNKDTVLVIIDYYSRYQEVKFLKTTTSAVIINKLMETFSRLGFPKSIRSDNGRQFVSNEFKEFCNHNGIELIHTPPYWPQANGEVENANKSILKRLKIAHANRQDYRTEIQKYILMYNVTPHGTTGMSPSQLLLGRNIRDKIPTVEDLFNNEVDEEARDRDTINKHKGKEKEDRIRGATDNCIEPGDQVLVKKMDATHKLETRFGNEEYEVIERVGNEVTVRRDGKTFKRHVTHVKKVPTNTEEQAREHAGSPTTSSSSRERIDSSSPDDLRLSSAGQNAEEEELGKTSEPKVLPLKLKKRE